MPPHPSPEVQAEMRAQAAAAATASGHVSLMAFRIYKLRLCVLVVCHAAEEGLAWINAHPCRVGHVVSLSDCSVRAVQRNVDLAPGVHLVARIPAGGDGAGHHTARTERGRASKRRKRARRRERDPTE